MFALEAALGAISFLEPLRPDEIAAAARRFTVATLAKDETVALGLRLALVVHGRAELEVELPGGGALRARLEAGDRCGDMALVRGRGHPARLTASAPTTLALLDRAGFDALLADHPAIALPLIDELARELASRDGLARELEELHAAGLPPAELTDALARARRALLRRGARVARPTARALFQRTVVARGAEPSFWMLIGFLASFAVARLVVAAILHFGLEHRLFMLVPGRDPNPMHVHHFNYGLILVGVSGLAALFPLGRRALRPLAFVFGAGCGLVFDEFALFWNLNPEYAQRMSLVAVALVVLALVQGAYFRDLWRGLLRRARSPR
jgi:CRP-like cAMP-binding protein